MTPIEQAAQALHELLIARADHKALANLTGEQYDAAVDAWMVRDSQAAMKARAALASLEAAEQEPLTPMQIDNMVAQTMDRVAKQLGLEHAMHLNSDILVCHTLRRALVQDAYALGAAAPSSGT